MIERIRFSTRELLESGDPWRMVTERLHLPGELDRAKVREILHARKEPLILEFDEFAEHPLLDIMEEIQQKNDRIYVIWGPEQAR